MWWFDSGSGVGEHTLNLGSKSGDNGGVEERVEPCQDHTADDNTDDDLDARIDISLTGGGCNSGLGGNCDGVEFSLNGIDEFFHVLITSFFLCFWILVFFAYCGSISD